MIAKPKKTPPRLLSVVDIIQVTPLLRRIVLGGDDLKGFPLKCFGSHIKIFIAKPEQEKLTLPSLGPKGPIWPPKELRPIVRTYSVRSYDPKENLLAVEFVIHGHKSFASDWALNAKIGDKLGIAGPGGPDPLIADAEFHIIAGDLSAVPGISALLENLDADCEGEVFIEVNNKEQIQDLVNVTKLKVNWLVQEKQYNNDLQVRAIEQCQVPEDKTLSAWIAGESSAVLSVRDHLRESYNLKKSHLYALPYWRRGNTEEEYHHDRHAVMEEEF